jgi:branched-subunit amino acid transport protein
MIDTTEFWIVTILLGLGTYVIRFSFIGFWGNRTLPAWAQAHLRYVAVAVFPALILPALIGVKSGAEVDWNTLMPRLAAGIVALLIARTGRATTAIVLGMSTLYAAKWLVG